MTTTRKVFADELMQSGRAQRLAAANALSDVTKTLTEELLAVPPSARAMTRSMTSALSRADSGMQLGRAGADLQQWGLTEEEYKEMVDRDIKTLRP